MDNDFLAIALHEQLHDNYMSYHMRYSRKKWDVGALVPLSPFA